MSEEMVVEKLGAIITIKTKKGEGPWLFNIPLGLLFGSITYESTILLSLTFWEHYI